MAIIDKMELFTEPDPPVGQHGSTHALFITIFRHYFTFSTAASQALKEPEYLHMYVDRKNKKVAFKPCPQDKAAITFCIKTPTGQRRASIFSRSKVTLLREMAGLQDSEDSKGIRFPAEYIEDEETLLVDLSAPLLRPDPFASILQTVPREVLAHSERKPLTQDEPHRDHPLREDAAEQVSPKQRKREVPS